MFYLDPNDIKDDSLKDYYNGFINQDQKQKFRFSAELQNDGLTIVSNKTFGEKQPEIKVNGERKAMNQIRDKFYVYFDSIKSPKEQAEGYKSECKDEIDYIEKNVDNFHNYISIIENKINDYIKAKDTINEKRKKLENAKKILEKIKIKKPKISNELEHLKKLKIALRVNELNSEIDSLHKDLEEINKKIKNEKIESKNEEAATKEVTEAHTQYLNLINKLDRVAISTEFPKDTKFLFQLKTNSSLKELEDAKKNLVRTKTELSQQLNKLKDSTDYVKLTFINRLRKFISENMINFKKTYPEFYDKIEGDYKKLKDLDGQCTLLNNQYTNIEGIYNTINVYLEVLNKAKFNPIYINGNDSNLKDVKDEIRYNLNLKESEYSKEISKLGGDARSLIEEAERYSLNELNSDIEQKEKGSNDLDEERINLETERRLNEQQIKDSQNIIKNPPEFLDDIDLIKKLKATSGHVINKVADVKSVINKIKENKSQNLNSDERQIAKDVGKYFGKYQIDIVHNYKTRRVKEIDLINGEYILDDNTSVNFRTNSGKILINTLLARIRNLPTNKKSVLLIDEVSPLDSNNIELLQKEIKKKIESGNVIFAVIVVPGNKKYSDKQLHIIEV